MSPTSQNAAPETRFHQSYRPDIDGLRAIAVLAVVFYHMGSPWLASGFIGVDIFFVISGFLITQVSLRRLQQGNFTIGQFIERRVRRILPALLVMIALCAPIAWVSMLPDDLENFGQSTVATILSANNLLLWLTSGYFQLENEFKPLYHTWSLAIEEQFYLLFPFVLAGLVAAWRRRRWRGPALALALLPLLASLILGLFGTGWIPRNGNYLLPFGRIWEIGAGAVAAAGLSWQASRTAATPALASGRSGLLLRGLGLLVLLLSLIVIRPSTPFPGTTTLLPVLGTLLLLAVPPQQRRGIDRLLAQPLLVAIGLISYSLYLWHQPVLAFLRIRSLQEPGLTEMAAALLLMTALAVASYLLVERPCRRPATVPTPWLLAGSGGRAAGPGPGGRAHLRFPRALPGAAGPGRRRHLDRCQWGLQRPGAGSAAAGLSSGQRTDRAGGGQQLRPRFRQRRPGERLLQAPPAGLPGVVPPPLPGGGGGLSDEP